MSKALEIITPKIFSEERNLLRDTFRAIIFHVKLSRDQIAANRSRNIRVPIRGAGGRIDSAGLI